MNYVNKWTSKDGRAHLIHLIFSFKICFWKVPSLAEEVRLYSKFDSLKILSANCRRRPELF